MELHSGKIEALLCWVNSWNVNEPIEQLSQLQDMSVLIKIVNKLNGNTEENAQILQRPLEERLKFLCTFLQSKINRGELKGYCRPGSSAENMVQWQKILQGENIDMEISKVIVLLFFYSAMSSKNPKKSEDFDHKTQTELACILRFVLDNEDELSLDDKLINFLQRKARFPSSSDGASSSSDPMSPNMPFKRKTEVRFLELHRVASSSAVKSLPADSPSSPMIEVLHTPQFQMRRLKKQLTEARECRDELELELAQNQKRLAEKEAQLSLMQQQIEHLRLLRENQADQQEPRELEELREKNESLMMRLRDTLKQCQDLKTDRKQLERKNDQLSEENGELSYKVRDLSNRLAQLQAALYETTEEHDISLTAWEQKQSELEKELGTAVTEKKYLEEQNLILQGKISLLEDQLKKMGERDSQEKGDCMGDILKLENLKQKVSDLTAQSEGLHARISQLEEEKSAVQAEMESQRTQFEHEKTQLQEIVTNLQTSLSEIAFQKEQQDNEARAQEENLTGQITTLKLEISKLKTSLAQKGEELEGLHQEVEEQKKLNSQLAENLQKQEESSKQNIQGLNKQLDHLGSVLTLTEGKVVELTGKLETETQQIAHLREEHKKIISERDSTLSVFNEYKGTKEEELSVLNKTVQTLERSHQTSLASVEELKREKADLALKVQELDATILDLIAKCQNLDTENDTQSKSHAATVESLKAQLVEQESQIKHYEQKVSSMELITEEHVQLKDQLLSMEENVKNLKELLENEKMRYTASLEGDQKRISELEGEIKKLSESRDQTLLELGNERAAGKGLETRLKQLEDEYRTRHEKLQLELSQTSAAIKQREEEREAASKEVDMWKTRYREAEQSLAQSSSQMDEQIAKLRKDHSEVCQQLQSEKEKVSNLEAQAKETNAVQVEKVSQLESDLSAAVSCIKEKENEVQNLMCKIQSAEEEMKKAHQGESERISQLEAALNSATQDLDRLSGELSEANHKKSELEATVKQLEEQKSERISSLEAELESTLASIKDREGDAQKLSGEVELLRRQLEEANLKHQEELALKSTEIRELTEEKEKATADFSTERATKLEMEAQLLKSIETHKSEFAALQNELSRSLDLITMKESEVERLSKEASLRQEELLVNQQTVTRLTEEVATLNSLKERVAVLEGELERHVQIAKDTNAQITELKAIISKKESEINSLEHEVQSGAKEHTVIVEKYQASLGEVQALQSKITDLEKMCREQDDMICRAQKEAADAKTAASEKASVSEQQQDGIRALETEISQERQKTSDLMRELDTARSLQVEKASELEALKKELYHKVQELEQSQKTLSESVTELSSVRSESQERERALNEVKEQVTKYKEEIEKKNEEMGHVQAEVKNLSSRLASKEEVSVEVQEQLSKETSKSTALEGKLKSLQEELEASSKELFENKATIDNLRTEAQKYLEEAEKQRVFIDGLQQKLSSQAEISEGLQQELKSWQERGTQKEDQISSLQQQLGSTQALVEELASLKTSYQELKADRVLMEEKNKEELLKYQKTSENLHAELEKTKMEMADVGTLKEKVHQQEQVLQTLQAEKDGYLTQITLLQQVNDRLVGEKQSLSEVSDQVAKRLEVEVSKVTEEHKRELETLHMQYEKSISEGKEKIQELSQKLEAVSSKYDHAKARVLDEREKFQEERQKLLNQVAQLEVAQKEHSQQVQELNQQLSQQEKSIRSQQQKLKQRESEGHEEVEKQQKRVSELEAQLEQQVQAVEHYKAQMEKAKVHYDAKKQQNQDLNEELQISIKEQDQLRKDNVDLKQEAERLSKELQHSLLQSKEAEQTCKNLTNQVRSLEAQVEYADRQLRELGKFQVATDAMKTRESVCVPRVTRSHPDVSIDSLDLSFDDDQPMNSTGKNGRSHQEATTSTGRAGSLESLVSNRLPRKVESLESLYFTPIPNRAQSKLDSSIGSIGDLSLDSSKKTRSARRRTTQVINITMTKKTKEEPDTESANTSFYSLRSAPSHQSLNQPNQRRGGRPQPAVSAPALSSLPSQESLVKPELTSSDDSLNNSVLMNLPGYRPSTRSSARLSQTGGRSSFYMNTCQDEPDPQEDWNRIAELQLRNRACPPHLKTSYPLESRPSLLTTTITDEEVKTGDPKETLRRASLLPSQIQESTAATRRTTLAPTGIEHSWGSNVTTRQMKRVSEESHQGPDTPESKRSASCFPRPMTPKDKHDARKLSMVESKTSVSQQQPQPSRRQSAAFSIFNTPKKLGNSLLKRGLSKKTVTPKNSPRGRGTTSGTSSSSNKSPHLSIRKSPSRRSPRVSSAKSPKTSGKFFERRQNRNK